MSIRDEAETEALRQIHGQPATRMYSVAEVKQIVYPILNALASRKPEAAPTLSEVPDGVIPWEFFAEAAGWVKPEAAPSVKHDHSGQPKVWCETHQHTHIAMIPRFTYLCKSCGFGQWYKPDAEAHEAACPGHETYEVEHVMRPVEAAPSDTDREALAELLFSIYDHGTNPNALREADVILAAGFSRTSQPVQVEVTTAIECSNARFELLRKLEAVEQDRQMILAGLADTREQLAAAQAIIAKVQRYAEEREAYGKRGRTVGSARIASDLLGILSQSSTDALQAHDRQVAAKAIADAADAYDIDIALYADIERRSLASKGFDVDSIQDIGVAWLNARAVSLVPGNPRGHDYSTDCPQWRCPHVSVEDRRDGETCTECDPCNCVPGNPEPTEGTES